MTLGSPASFGAEVTDEMMDGKDVVLRVYYDNPTAPESVSYTHLIRRGQSKAEGVFRRICKLYHVDVYKRQMQSGLVYGSACMIDAMLERICDEYGKSFTVIATVGISHFIIPHGRTEIENDENLILKGLYVIFKKNNK